MTKQRAIPNEKPIFGTELAASSQELRHLSLFELLEHFSKDLDRVALALDCYHRGRETFPRVEWNRVDFTRMCFEHWGTRSITELEASMTDLARAEEYLVRACLARRPGSTETLERLYLGKANARIRRICRDSHLADEALQALREKLLLPPRAKLGIYESKGQLAAWLGVVAERTALDVSRQHKRSARRFAPLEDSAFGNSRSPESDYGARQLESALTRLITEALGKLPSHLRFALERSVFSGWSIDRIGEALSTHRSTSARWLASARKTVELEVRGAILHEMGVNPDELKRVLRARPNASESFSPLFELVLPKGSKLTPVG